MCSPSLSSSLFSLFTQLQSSAAPWMAPSKDCLRVCRYPYFTVHHISPLSLKPPSDMFPCMCHIYAKVMTAVLLSQTCNTSVSLSTKHVWIKCCLINRLHVHLIPPSKITVINVLPQFSSLRHKNKIILINYETQGERDNHILLWRFLSYFIYYRGQCTTHLLRQVYLIANFHL